MENLYAIDDMLYTHEKLVEMKLEQDVQYDYVEPISFDLGNKILLITDNNNANFEIIKEISKGIYKSLTVESIDILRNAFETIQI